MKGLVALQVDGQASDAQWPLDRGLQYGDGLFETMIVRGGRVRFEALHRARLAEGCARLAIHIAESTLWHQVRTFASATPDATLKLLLTRGGARERGYAPAGDEAARTVLYRFAAPDPPPADGVSLTRLAVTLGENPLLAGIKHCNRLELVLARMHMQGSRALEGLLASSSGLLISGTMSNVFVCLRGEWMTPRIDRCGIAGVTRAVVLREAAALGQPVREVDLPFTLLDDIEALCISNVRLGLLPVTALDGRQLAVPAWASNLKARLAGLDE